MFRRGKPVSAPSRPEVARAQNAAKPAAQGPAHEPSYIGPDVSIDGNVVCAGEIHINGELRGTVQATTCLVDANGHVNGAITAQYVVVRGRVVGPIHAQQVNIAAGAHVEGDVTHQGLAIEQGAYVAGTISQGRAPAAAMAEDIDDLDILPALPGKLG